MSSTDIINQLYDIIDQVKCLRDENLKLREELKQQEIRHKREIELISGPQHEEVESERDQLYHKDARKIEDEDEVEDEYNDNVSNFNLQLNVSNIPNLAYTPLTPKKKRRVKQEPNDNFIEPFIAAPASTKSFTRVDGNLPQRDALIEDSEFARLPTQYSDQSNSPLKSQNFSFSPIKFQESSPVKVPEDNSIEVIDDSDIEYDLLVKPREDDKVKVKIKQESSVVIKKENGNNPFTPPCTGAVLADITNIPSKLTPLQTRDYVRNVLKDKFYNEPSFKLLIDDKNPIYDQIWQISDFKPNPSHTKANLKRKIGKTKKEQQEIDRFYKLAGPGIQLKSIQWDKSEQIEAQAGGEEDCVDMNEVDEDLAYRRQLSQIYDRFPSPPGFNDVDFPTTQEERERRIETEKIQTSRIKSRLKEAINQKGYIFRENILNEFVKAGRLEKKNKFR